MRAPYLMGYMVQVRSEEILHHMLWTARNVGCAILFCVASLAPLETYQSESLLHTR